MPYNVGSDDKYHHHLQRGAPLAKTARVEIRLEPDELAEFDAAIEGMLGDRSDHLRLAMRQYVQSLRLSRNTLSVSPVSERVLEASS